MGDSTLGVLWGFLSGGSSLGELLFGGLLSGGYPTLGGSSLRSPHWGFFFGSSSLEASILGASLRDLFFRGLNFGGSYLGSFSLGAPLSWGGFSLGSPLWGSHLMVFWCFQAHIHVPKAAQGPLEDNTKPQTPRPHASACASSALRNPHRPRNHQLHLVWVCNSSKQPHAPELLLGHRGTKALSMELKGTGGTPPPPAARGAWGRGDGHLPAAGAI